MRLCSFSIWCDKLFIKLDVKSFENLKDWIELVKENSKKSPKLFFVGNKIDIQNKQVSSE